MEEWKRRYRGVNRGVLLEELEDELSGLKLGKLIKRARNLGIENSEIEAAKEKEDIIELIIARTKEIEELKAMNKKLQAQVAELSAALDVLEDPSLPSTELWGDPYTPSEFPQMRDMGQQSQLQSQSETTSQHEFDKYLDPGVDDSSGFLWSEYTPSEFPQVRDLGPPPQSEKPSQHEFDKNLDPSLPSPEPAPSEGVSDLGSGIGVGGGKRRKKSQSKKKKKSKNRKKKGKSKRKRSKTRRRR